MIIDHSAGRFLFATLYFVIPLYGYSLRKYGFGISIWYMIFDSQAQIVARFIIIIIIECTCLKPETFKNVL